jgi:FKBP-type peptidyl-prolyl cis-trans isomerase FkpA
VACPHRDNAARSAASRGTQELSMMGFARVLLPLAAATVLMGAAMAQETDTLATPRARTSYAIGMDVAHVIAPIAVDMDTKVFEQSLRDAAAGKAPAIAEQDAKATDAALRARVAARAGNAAAGSPVPAVDRTKVGQLVGGLMIGPSLASLKDDIELPVLLQAVRTVLAGRKPLLTDAQAKSTLQAFTEQRSAAMDAAAAAAGSKNKTEGDAFLARNKAVTGVYTTPSGLQYRVLRQGAGPHPKPGDKVRVNYRGTLLDGTVFDSSYERGQPEEFGLDQVIPGWSEGVGMMPVGAKYRFWIPAALGYGMKGTPGGPIGPNATLVFDVELLSIL